MKATFDSKVVLPRLYSTSTDQTKNLTAADGPRVPFNPGYGDHDADRDDHSKIKLSTSIKAFVHGVSAKSTKKGMFIINTVSTFSGPPPEKHQIMDTKSGWV